MRALLVKFLTMSTNHPREPLFEFGVAYRAGHIAGLDEITERMAEHEDTQKRHDQ